MSTHIPPSQCEQCVPVETHGDYVTHYAHETECTNARKGRRK
jgi:hypothetical protein